MASVSKPKPCSPFLGEPLDLRHDALVVLVPEEHLELLHDALVVLVALRVAVGAGVLLNNLLDVLAELHSTIFWVIFEKYVLAQKASGRQRYLLGRAF